MNLIKIYDTQKNQNQGMTFSELVLAIFMLIAFTGFTVMIVRYTARFFQPLNEELKKNTFLQVKSYKIFLMTKPKSIMP